MDIFFSPSGAGAHRGSRRPSPPSSGGPRPPSAKAHFDLTSSLNTPFVRRNESRDRRKAAALLSRSHIHHTPRPGVDWQAPIQNAIANHGSPTPLLPTQRGNPPPPPLRTEASGIYRRANTASPVRPLFFIFFYFQPPPLFCYRVLFSVTYLLFKNRLCRCLSLPPPTSDCLAAGVCCSLVKAAATCWWVVFFSKFKKRKALLHPQGRFIWFMAETTLAGKCVENNRACVFVLFFDVSKRFN